MVVLVVVAALASAGAGLLVMGLLNITKSRLSVTWKEYAVVLLIFTPIVVIVVSLVGWNVAKSNKLSFNEYWNGWELEAVEVVIECYRDGPCVHEYDCDSYPCNPHDCFCTCTSHDKDGNCTSESCQTCWDTCWHDCPYATYEYTYIVKTTLPGDHVIGANHFAPGPAEWRWGSGIPGHVPRGAPQFWLEAKARIEAGTPDGVTQRMQYDNFILASQWTILKEYSNMIDQYLELGLLPPVEYGTHNFYYANKVHFVGYSPADPEAWQDALMHLNAALGTELQGDLHLVIVQNSTVSSNPDAYANALNAYWQNPGSKEEGGWGDDAISKNSIVVVVGTTDGETVAWARATTGMPLGNEHMQVAIRNELKGVALTPEALIGEVSGEFYHRESDGKLKVRGLHGQGVLERVLWGLDNPQTQFVRVSMSGDDPDDVGTGFLYLDSEIQPDAGQKFWIVFWSFWVCMVGWGVVAMYGERPWRRNRRRIYR